MISVTERQSYILRCVNWRRPAARRGSRTKPAGRHEPDLLLEFFSEEIPARMQRGPRRICAKWSPTSWWPQVTYDGAKAFATPRG